MKRTWKVKLFEAATQSDFVRGGKAAEYVDTFGVQADGSDAAKREARAWLELRGHAVRSMAVAADEERTLVAYLVAGSVEKAKQDERKAAS